MPPASPSRVSLPDRYRVVRHLANGGMASVWEAHDELLDRDVAVKVLASHLGEDDRARRRFQREARAAAGLSSHPNVVTIYDVGEHSGRVFMVMEIMRGGTLGDRLKSREDVPHERALRWLHQAAAALDAAHDAGVVHRDIKPGNLLLDSHDRLAVADFGIARVAWEDQLTATGQVLGTAAYLSPEQALGEPATAASDRYALAVVAYELLTGRRPFEAEHFAAQARAHVEDPVPPASSRAVIPLSKAVDATLEKGLAKDADDRWRSAAEFVDALERTLAPGEETKPTRLLGRRGRPAPRRDDARGGAAAGWAGDDARGSGRAADDAQGGRAGDAARGGGATGWAGDDGGRGDNGARGWDDAGARRGDATRVRPRAGGGGNGRAATGRGVGAPEPRRRSAAPLLAGLAVLILLAAAGAAIALSRGDGGGETPRAQRTPSATATAEKTETATPEATKTETPEPTDTPTPEPTETQTPEPTETPQTTQAPSGSPSELQAKGHTALLNGDNEGALANLKAAIDQCGDSGQVDPCAYAMYDYGQALLSAGRPAEAVQVLEARLARFDDQNDTVRALLKKAREAAKGNRGPKGDKGPKGPKGD
jgi:serine/threonine-protein kinase